MCRLHWSRLGSNYWRNTASKNMQKAIVSMWLWEANTPCSAQLDNWLWRHYRLWCILLGWDVINMVNSSFTGVKWEFEAFSDVHTNMSIYCDNSDSSCILGKCKLLHATRCMLLYHVCLPHCRCSTEVWDRSAHVRSKCASSWIMYKLVMLTSKVGKNFDVFDAGKRWRPVGRHNGVCWCLFTPLMVGPGSTH